MVALPWTKFRRSEVNLKNLKAGELRLLILLGQNCDRENTVRTTYEHLAQAMGCTRRHAINQARALEDKGYIEKLALAGRYIAIWLKRGFGHGNVDEPIHPPTGWATQAHLFSEADDELKQVEPVDKL